MGPPGLPCGHQDGPVATKTLVHVQEQPVGPVTLQLGRRRVGRAVLVAGEAGQVVAAERGRGGAAEHGGGPGVDAEHPARGQGGEEPPQKEAEGSLGGFAKIPASMVPPGQALGGGSGGLRAAGGVPVG